MGCGPSKNSAEPRSPIRADKFNKSKRSNSGVADLKHNYSISKSTPVLGTGSFGKVFLSQSIANPDHKVAIKVLNKEKVGESLDVIKREIRTLTALDHPNIIKYYETYDDAKYMYLVMEYCS